MNRNRQFVVTILCTAAALVGLLALARRGEGQAGRPGGVEYLALMDVHQRGTPPGMEFAISIQAPKSDILAQSWAEAYKKLGGQGVKAENVGLGSVFNVLGADGWELCGTVVDTHSPNFYMTKWVFKRPK